MVNPAAGASRVKSALEKRGARVWGAFVAAMPLLEVTEVWVCMETGPRGRRKGCGF